MGKGSKAKPEKRAFTKKALFALPVPDTGRVYHYDAVTPGLACCVSSAGSRTFFVYKWALNRPQRIRIGRFPELSVENARDIARAIVGDIARGVDPMAEKRKLRQVPTVKELFEVWRDSYAKGHRKSWRDDERQFNLYLSGFHGRRINSLKTSEVAVWHNETGQKHGRYTANRAFELLRTMFNKARELLKYDGGNPCHGLKKFKEQQRDRFLQADELPRFFAALDSENELYRDYILTALYTGARRNNVSSMAWADINMENKLWRIPEGKSGQPIVIPLCPPAMEILERRARARGDSPWVFPSSRGGHLVDASAPWRRVLKTAGIENLRFHDLRRSLGSWQALGGASLLVIGKSLGHRSTASTLVYSRLTVEPVRESIDRATAAMVAAGTKKPENGGQDNATKSEG
jgi:integrase